MVREVDNCMNAFLNKNIAITGGSSGLGLALAAALVQRGAQVTLIARDPTRLAAARSQLLESKPAASVETIAIDITDRAQTAAAFGSIGSLDILINSAGILNEGRFDLQPEDEFEAVIQTNLLGTVNTTRAALPLLKASDGRLVNIASLAGLMGVYGYTAYSASKHALVGFTESLRFELEQDGVTVHLVCPSEFDSPMVDALDRTRSPENRAHVLTLPKVEVEKIVSATLRGVERNQFFIVPGARARAAAFGGRLAPGITRRVGDRVVAKARRK
ncbi:MAG: SDR family NAD(P)-dependent oxidoreductase [Thermoleophilaceae bacterium]|nr:SDR family NAD(P)-dependent oxidoreductase [Thermoleophilaceae bacterium]